MPADDRVLRAMTDDDSFRVMTAFTTQTVTRIVELQRTPPDQIERFGGLITGTILVRETMAPTLRVQGVVRGVGGRGTIVADAHPDGGTRGLFSLPKDVKSIDLGDGAVLMMMRTLPGGKLHQGVVSLQRATTVSDALMTYMLESEQVKSMIDVACIVDDGQVLAAGGYIVQLLPELPDSQLAIMTERLTDFPPMGQLLAEGQGDPQRVLDELLYGMPYSMLGDSALRFACNCSHMRVVASLASLGRDELRDLSAGGKSLEIACDFCGKEYAVTQENLKGLLSES